MVLQTGFLNKKGLGGVKHPEGSSLEKEYGMLTLRGAVTCGLALTTVLLMGCNQGPPRSPAPTSINGNPAPSAVPTAGATQSVATLVISEYGVALTLPEDIKDATYRIDQSDATRPTPGTDAKGRQYVALPGVRMWPRRLASDPACASVTRAGLVGIMVFPADPTGLVFPSGPRNFKHVGQYWFGVSQENAYACSNQNPNEWPDVGLLLQAYETIHPA